MRAFTLVELLVVVAIIGILGIIALPMYSNYATKSKFTEVELATAPIKTFVSTCAVSGDCVSAGAISLGSAAAVGTPATAPPTLNAAQLAIYSVLYPWEKLYDGVALANQYAVSDSATFAASYHMGADPSNPQNSCLIGNGTTACSSFNNTSYVLTSTSIPNTSVLVYSGAAPTGGTAMSVPCVGAAGGCSPATKYTLSASSDSTGVITSTAQSSFGLKGETFVLVPALSGGRVDWLTSGTCKTRSAGALC